MKIIINFLSLALLSQIMTGCLFGHKQKPVEKHFARPIFVNDQYALFQLVTNVIDENCDILDFCDELLQSKNITYLINWKNDTLPRAIENNQLFDVYPISLARDSNNAIVISGNNIINLELNSGKYSHDIESEFTNKNKINSNSFFYRLAFNRDSSHVFIVGRTPSSQKNHNEKSILYLYDLKNKKFKTNNSLNEINKNNINSISIGCDYGAKFELYYNYFDSTINEIVYKATIDTLNELHTERTPLKYGVLNYLDENIFYGDADSIQIKEKFVCIQKPKFFLNSNNEGEFIIKKDVQVLFQRNFIHLYPKIL